MTVNVQELIQRAGKLPPMPQAARKALNLIRDPNSSVAQVATALALDQVLSSLVLGYANSAHYGMDHRVTSVHQAVMILGQNTVGSLILTASVSNFLNRPLPGYDMERGDLWKHSIGVAAAARLIAQPRGVAFAEDAYYAGLMCDIGKLALDRLFQLQPYQRQTMENKSFLEVERILFGIDHAALGSAMAHNWQFPEPLEAAIGCHHAPRSAGQHQLLASIVHIADAALMMLGVGMGRDGLSYPLDEQAFARVGWDPQRVEELYAYASREIERAEVFIGNAL